MLAGIRELTFDWDDQLRDHGEHLGPTLFKHVKGSLNGQEAVRVCLLSDPFHEDRQVVMVVQLGYIDLPVNSVVPAMLDGDGKVSAVVKAAEL